ncbi:MAG: hypothetical protein H0X51_09050 [Parachlamydiaceae bacterium]|nr:hypothetical protein [Parachlamydiaceae bacterium]
MTTPPRKRDNLHLGSPDGERPAKNPRLQGPDETLQLRLQGEEKSFAEVAGQASPQALARNFQLLSPQRRVTLLPTLSKEHIRGVLPQLNAADVRTLIQTVITTQYTAENTPWYVIINSLAQNLISDAIAAIPPDSNFLREFVVGTRDARFDAVAQAMNREQLNTIVRTLDIKQAELLLAAISPEKLPSDPYHMLSETQKGIIVSSLQNPALAVESLSTLQILAIAAQALAGEHKMTFERIIPSLSERQLLVGMHSLTSPAIFRACLPILQPSSLQQPSRQLLVLAPHMRNWQASVALSDLSLPIIQGIFAAIPFSPMIFAIDGLNPDQVSFLLPSMSISQLTSIVPKLNKSQKKYFLERFSGAAISPELRQQAALAQLAIQFIDKPISRVSQERNVQYQHDYILERIAEWSPEQLQLLIPLMPPSELPSAFLRLREEQLKYAHAAITTEQKKSLHETMSHYIETYWPSKLAVIQTLLQSLKELSAQETPDQDAIARKTAAIKTALDSLVAIKETLLGYRKLIPVMDIPDAEAKISALLKNISQF